MKKYLLVLSFAFLSISAFAQSKIGTIDAEYILNQMPEMAQVNEGLKTYNTDLQKELESNVATYETLVTDYQANSTTLSEEDRTAKESEIINLENDIKNFRQKATVMIQMKRNELTQPLYEKINEAMMKVIQEENYTQIFHAGGNDLAYSSQDSDITLKVLNILGIEETE
ncbi:OmpH family outer membrane protein [Salinimicrobium sediminilitoris]|uniref:OmpH family outer membrane protein n=1 Tax=Salinimicrobium sediminilitoris TaxID=2876715 RepID=UPI001E5254A8|nr:OmpH family outer membrane protein [Salinimicrobium sediminilitoris]MCC8358586.1 OmpH family outer membrane protein [Salinimicrobium sediminilitoris]